MKTIQLYKSNGSWMSADLIDGKPNPAIVHYFGTHRLPTAFLDQASGAEVYATISKLNPDAKVIVIVD